MDYSADIAIEKILPYLQNIEVGRHGDIAHFCPFCQKNGLRQDGRQWSDSKRKGYILLGDEKRFPEAIFYCHNEQCSSRSMIEGRKGLPLDIYADYVMSIFSENSSLAISDSSIANQGSDGSVKITKLASSNPSHQKACGKLLDRKIAAKKGRQRCLWTGYADRRAGKRL